MVELIADIDRATPFVLRGSGGMAKAVAAAFRDSGFGYGTIVARNEAVGRGLADLYGFGWASELGEGAPLLVNVTPIGMTGGNEDQLAFPEAMIAQAEIAFDVVQYPPETRFLSVARGLGKRIITGTEVATIQALEQFVLYTGVRPTPEQVQEAADYARSLG
ncbi:shikimate 5-dehydrogenase [Sphingomonas sp. SORGH_AS 879]|nr:shikimate 5-dehydrogenase [Sphingomonas sp. SORGH_AS_0879]